MSVYISYDDAAPDWPDPITSPPFPLLSLPSEIIRSILVYCKHATLQSLRRSCKRIKNVIDNDAIFDRPLFRDRPSTNPVLTTAELKKIKRLAMAREVSRKDSPPYDRDFDAASPTPVNRFIQAHPIFDKFAWSFDMDWTKACLLDFIPLHAEGAAVINNECATNPPVRTLEVLVTRKDIAFHTFLRRGGECQPEAAEVGIDEQQEQDEQCDNSTSHKVLAIRIKDVIQALAEIADEWKRQHPQEIPFGADYVWPLRNTSIPYLVLGLYITKEGWLCLELADGLWNAVRQN
ncbi:hypothetical protein A4X13_0g2977 [Tilletia indica]|uniref:F-box domain-containing protein n=1 Tax=Tilletia indica TaxID=43049 RepID=A0A8T8T4C2_9BASI|nr:hypothetical protein A4X13_0g2977 [Tilletia indica]